HLASSGHSL
nr:Chain C, Synthetic peptide HIS-LEU-ALA-SER-SER-GLY-HIS-SER-LEU [synthetic construct]6UZP_C Chain C, Synthetic peptide HIS-LEU-ALA-SER-SER-GLY-HIS-SER-LEU [synthetic construct]